MLGLTPGIVDRLVYAFAPGAKLVLWPGWKAALAVSATVVVLGVIMHIRRESIAGAQRRFARGRLFRLSADEAYQWTLVALNRVADRITGVVQHGSLPLYLAVILTAVIATPMAAFGFAGGVLSLPTGPFSLPEAGMALLVVVPALAALRVSSRMVAVLLLGAVGYAMAGVFVLYGAPDLALTLLLVETVVIAIFAFVLSRLPRNFEIMVWRIRSAVRAAVAVAVGGFVTAAALLASGQRSPGPSPSAAYRELAPAAGGKNIVNVILTDFRALDTLGEITVIATAAIGVAALISGFRTPAEEAP